MIIHIWMHWFWITTAYFKGFLFFTASTISISCISLPCFAEAGLLDNETLTQITTILPIGNESSQITQNPTVVHPPDTTPQVMSSNLPEETFTEELDTSKTAFGSTSDLADTYNGGTLDVYSYPFKKVTKFAHPKYAKTKAKGKLNDEPGNQENKMDAVKIVEEKVNINISVENGVNRSEPAADKSNDNLSDESTPEIAVDAPESVTTTIVENVTETLTFNFTAKVTPNLTEDQKEIEVLKNETLVIESKVEESRAFTTVEPFAVRNRVAAATSAQNFKTEESGLNAGSITGITLGILVVFSLFGAVSFVLYRRRYLNKPQVLHDKCSNLDSSGYIDETSLRENSEEMYSLDNDSFLNSLEAMTIQNYWTESVKHTKL